MKKRFLCFILTLAIILTCLNTSFPKVSAASKYNYAKLLQESLYFYDANMCGGDVSSKSAFSWRSNCHLGDKNVKINGKSVDVSGGFHDAGDHLKAGLPQGYAATMLGLAYMEYKSAFDDTKSTEHLKKITTHFCEYFERCTVTKSNGSVDFFVYQVSDGDEDHKKWEAPEKQMDVRHVYYTSAGNPATDEVSEAAAALAVQYINFKDTKALSYAKKLFAYAKSFSNKSATKEGLYDSSTGGYLYDSQSWGDDYALAAALLYKATGDSSYKNEFDKIKNSSEGGYNIWSWLSWDNVSALADYYGAGSTESLKNCANNMKASDSGYSCLLAWGSCRYNCNAQFLGLLYDKASGTSDFKNWSTNQMNYILGNNPQNKCFVVGYSSNSAKYPHHRAASNSTDAGITSANHHILLGALVGGPTDSNGTYSDNQADYQCNEVALDYNAGLVFAAAGLYTVYKKDSSVPKSLMTKSDTDSMKMRFTYNSGSSDSSSEKPELTLSNSGKKIKIKWNKVSGATVYSIERTIKGKNSFKEIGRTTGKNTFVDKKAKNGNVYQYRVTAYKNNKKLIASNPVTFACVNNVSITGLANPSAKNVTLKWKKSSKITGYQIQYSTSSNFAKSKTVKVNKNLTQKKFTKLQKGKTYYVRIRAYKKSGGKMYYSSWSKKKIKVTK
jgi:hypothetical protein